MAAPPGTEEPFSFEQREGRPPLYHRGGRVQRGRLAGQWRGGPACGTDVQGMPPACGRRAASGLAQRSEGARGADAAGDWSPPIHRASGDPFRASRRPGTPRQGRPGKAVRPTCKVIAAKVSQRS